MILWHFSFVLKSRDLCPTLGLLHTVRPVCEDNKAYIEAFYKKCYTNLSYDSACGFN